MALLRKAVAMIPRIGQIQSDHQAMWKLRTRNMIRDSVYKSYNNAKVSELRVDVYCGRADTLAGGSDDGMSADDRTVPNTHALFHGRFV